jgi:hypothetical protein
MINESILIFVQRGLFIVFDHSDDCFLKGSSSTCVNNRKNAVKLQALFGKWSFPFSKEMEVIFDHLHVDCVYCPGLIGLGIDFFPLHLLMWWSHMIVLDLVICRLWWLMCCPVVRVLRNLGCDYCSIWVNFLNV